jgi:hypothetical protein
MGKIGRFLHDLISLLRIECREGFPPGEIFLGFERSWSYRGGFALSEIVVEQGDHIDIWSPCSKVPEKQG